MSAADPSLKATNVAMDPEDKAALKGHAHKKSKKDKLEERKRVAAEAVECKAWLAREEEAARKAAAAIDAKKAAASEHNLKVAETVEKTLSARKAKAEQRRSETEALSAPFAEPLTPAADKDKPLVMVRRALRLSLARARRCSSPSAPPACETALRASAACAGVLPFSPNVAIPSHAQCGRPPSPPSPSSPSLSPVPHPNPAPSIPPVSPSPPPSSLAQLRLEAEAEKRQSRSLTADEIEANLRSAEKKRESVLEERRRAGYVDRVKQAGHNVLVSRGPPASALARSLERLQRPHGPAAHVPAARAFALPRSYSSARA
jgi:hypothetical protein